MCNCSVRKSDHLIARPSKMVHLSIFALRSDDQFPNINDKTSLKIDFFDHDVVGVSSL